MNLFITLLTIIANNYPRQDFNHEGPNAIVAADTLRLCLVAVHEMKDAIKDLERSLVQRSLVQKMGVSKVRVSKGEDGKGHAAN